MRQILNECYEGFIEPLQKKTKCAISIVVQKIFN